MADTTDNVAASSGINLLKKFDLIGHPMIKALHEHGVVLFYQQVGEQSEFLWVAADLGKHGTTIGDFKMPARTVNEAASGVEFDFVKKAVLWSAEGVLAAIEGKPEAVPDADTMPPVIGSAHVSHNAAAKLAKAKAELAQMTGNLTPSGGSPTLTPYEAEVLGLVKSELKAKEVPEMKFFPNEDLQTATPVKLADATMMYQPVRGSGKGTRYFVVGIAPLLKIAARLKGKALSVRVEGSALSNTKVLEHLATLGLGTDKGGYLSVHLDAEDPTTANKAIGSMLAAINCELVGQWDTPAPSVAKLQGLGS